MPDRRILILALAPALVAQQPAEDVRALFLRARALQLKGTPEDMKAAAALYRKVVSLEPGSSEANLRLSEALRDCGDLEAALAPAQRAAALAPEGAEAAAHLGILQYHRVKAGTGKPREAMDALAKAGSRLPMDVEVWYRLAELSEQEKDEALALKAWSRLARLRPSAQEAWERVAFHAKNLGRYEARREAVLTLGQRKLGGPDGMRVLRLLEELARDQVEASYLAHAEETFLCLTRNLPDEAGLWENIGLVRLQAQRWKESLEALDRAEALKDSTRIGFNRAYALLHLDREAAAEARLKSLLDEGLSGETELFKGQVTGLYARALLLQGKNEAFLNWEKAAHLPAPVLPEMASLHVQALLRLKRWEEAYAALQEGVKTFPEGGLFREAKAMPEKVLSGGFLHKGAREKALRHLERSATAQLHAEFDQWEPCLKAAQEARSLSQARAVDLLLLQANALDNLRRPKESMQVLREAQKLEPGNATLQNNLGYLLLEQGGDLTEAAKLIESASASQPKNASITDSLGWVQFKQGKVAEAEATLRRAATLNPYSPEVRKHLGEVLLSQGKTREAAEQWERALAYPFPDRAALEKRLAELKIRLAKQEAEGKEPEAPETPAEEVDE
ncbi:MAG TPA: tetratricopeptide repeat protein [Holophagaceae bacterium]|nr:tetratricopeptide repeat protein [Holophagaceae bacterium]